MPKNIYAYMTINIYAKVSKHIYANKHLCFYAKAQRQFGTYKYCNIYAFM